MLGKKNDFGILGGHGPFVPHPNPPMTSPRDCCQECRWSQSRRRHHRTD